MVHNQLPEGWQGHWIFSKIIPSTAFIYSTIYSTTVFISNYCLVETFPNAGGTAVNKMDKMSRPNGAYLLMQEMDNKYMT